MKTLVVGCNGQLGQAMKDTIPDQVEFVGADLPGLDITDESSVRKFVRQLMPDVIVNAAAYTAVDAAESHSTDAFSVNVDGPRNLARAAKEIDARLIHVSTDFVFDGDSATPYQPDDLTNPLSVYGQTKRDGEVAAIEAMPNSTVVVRTAWLYSKTGSNFVKSMLRLMTESDELSVVSDQLGAPTWAKSLAQAVWKFVDAVNLAGIFHWTDGGVASWYEFAMAIQEEALSLGLLDCGIPINAITTDGYPTAAKRPGYSVLDSTSTVTALNLPQVQWRVNLRSMLEGYK